MSEELVPRSRVEQLLDVLLNGGEAPEPLSRVEAYLYALIQKSANGGATDEQIAAAVYDYLDENPVEAYTLPVAAPEALGGVKPVAATEEMTEDVGVDEEGRLKAKPGSGSGISVTGATVGQTVKIAAVDEKGVPTAWEPVDMASGGTGEWELISDITLEENAYSIYVDVNDEGEAFAYRDIAVRIINGSTACGSWHKIYRRYGMGDTLFSWYGNITANKTIMLFALAQKGMGYLGVYGYQDSDSGIACLSEVDTETPITCFEIWNQYELSAGTQFIIYGRK